MHKNSLKTVYTVKSPFSFYSIETVLLWEDAGQNIFSSLPLDSPFSTLSSGFFFQFRMKFPLKTNKVTMEDMNTALGATTEEEKTKTLLLVYTVFLEPKSGYKIVVN